MTSVDPTAVAMIQDYQTMVKWNSLVRVVFPLFVLSVIVVFIIVTVLGVMSSFPEKKVTTETVKAGEELLPILNKVVRTFVDEVAPQLASEFQRGLEEGSEKLVQTLAEEITKLEKDMGEYVKNKIHEAMVVELKDHKALLLEVFPELKDDPAKLEKLAVRVNKAFEMWTVHYMLTTLDDFYIAMAKINDTVIKGYRTAPGTVSGAEPVQEGEMLELFMELMNAAYAEPLMEEPAAEGKAPETPKPPEATPPPVEPAPAPGPAAATEPAPAEAK
jgi:hypothetical protein